MRRQFWGALALVLGLTVAAMAGTTNLNSLVLEPGTDETNSLVIKNGSGTAMVTVLKSGATTWANAQTHTQDITLDDGASDTPILTFQDGTDETVAIKKIDTGFLTLTPSAAEDGLNVLTGCLKVGNGTPGVTLNGEDAYVEGTLEVDGTVQLDGTVTLTAGQIDTTEVLNGSLLAADQAYPGRGRFTVCGDATTVNNNTVYYGPDQTVVSSATVGLGRKCNTTAAGNTTEATADEPAYNAKAFQILSMDCTHADANAALTFTARTAAGATVPSVTCTDADNDTDCIAAIQTTTAVASGATFAVAVSSTADVGTVPFVCVVDVAF